MYEIQPKKLMIINVLDILRKYTDENHRLSQKEILEILERDYSMSADRKSVKSNLMNLIDFGYPINYTESVRKDQTGEDKAVLTDWYYSHEFDNSELRLLIDGLLFSPHIPYKSKKELIEKLENLSSMYFHKNVRHTCYMQKSCISNRQLFYTIDILDDAIEKKLQVEFTYCSFDHDKKLHPRLDASGNPRKYIVNPYQLAIKNSHYYLICNYDKYDKISNYRVDRITDIKILDTPVKPPEKTSANQTGLLLAKHINEHIYMFTGDTIHVTFRAKRYITNDIIDYFGTLAEFSDITDDEMTVRVTITEEDMFKWAVQYAGHTVVLEPVSLRERIIEELQKALKNYGEE